MRAILVVAMSLAVMTRVANPADYYAPSPLGQYSWIGPYIGATAGYEWGRASNNATRPSGFTGGIEAGYNWPRGNFLFGGEADINLSAADAIAAPFEFSNPWLGTTRGRGGMTVGNVLIFGTAGLSYGEAHANTCGLPESHTSVGWVAGAGLGAGFTQRWSAKAEWLYLNLADRSFAVTGTNNGLTANLLRFGLNYRF
jgi:outer membrane immunogenic protein